MRGRAKRSQAILADMKSVRLALGLWALCLVLPLGGAHAKEQVWGAAIVVFPGGGYIDLAIAGAKP